MHFRALDSWRGIAALMVALSHLHVHGHLFELSIVRNAWLFVDFFFVLSGFVIAHAYADRLSTGEQLVVFTIRRFGRLWPLHVATAVAAIALIDGFKLALGLLFRFETPAFAGTTWTWTQAVANLLMLHGFGLSGADPINNPSWSIGVEFYVYLVFAGVCLVARTRLLGVSLAIAALALMVLVVKADATLAVPLRYVIVRGLYGFFIGVVVLLLWRRRSASPLPHMPAWEVASAVLAVVYVSVAGASWLTLAAPLVFALVIFIFAYEAGPLSRVLKTAPMLWIGICSYSIYMVHMPVYHLMERIVLTLERRFNLQLTAMVGAPWYNSPVPFLSFGNKWLMDVAAVVGLALVVGVASLTYLAVEHPARRFFNDLARRRRAVVASA
jgi:peptidoglycan/LPS O-acetylase OafA/YrhL